VVDFFEATIAFFKILPTWGWLSAGGIRPSNTTAYSLSRIQSALTRGFDGKLPYVGCSGPRYNTTTAGQNSTDNGFTVLTEVWYYHHVNGRPQARQGVRLDANITGGSVTNCARTDGAIWYYERTKASEN